MRRTFYLLVIFLLGVHSLWARQIRFVFISDLHYGIERQFNGKRVSSDLVNRAMADAVRALPEVDPARVYLLGQSQGGFVSTMVADERPADVAGLFLLYPALVIHDDAVGRFGSPDAVPQTYEMWMELGRRYAVDAMAWDPYEHMGYPGPVRIWQGDADPLVPLAYAERAARTYANAELEVVHDAGHGFYGIRMRRILAQIVASITGV